MPDISYSHKLGPRRNKHVGYFWSQFQNKCLYSNAKGKKFHSG